jgi:hypothetical protein
VQVPFGRGFVVHQLAQAFGASVEPCGGFRRRTVGMGCLEALLELVANLGKSYQTRLSIDNARSKELLYR